jgi:hypothetical protein
LNLIYYLFILDKYKINKKYIDKMGIGDWGLGIGDWGLGIGPNPQSPIPNPHYHFILYYLINFLIKMLINLNKK